MALNPQVMDGLEGVDSPQDVQDAQQSEFNKSQQGTSSQALFGTGTLVGRSLFGNPRLEQAQNTQQAVGNAVSDSDARAPDQEDGLDAQVRRLKAVYTAVADKSPQAALQIGNKIALLQEAQNQQTRLKAQTDLEVANAKKAGDLDSIALHEQGTYTVGNQATGKIYGTVHQFQPDGTLNPTFQKEIDQLKADSKDPQAQEVQSKQWWNNRLQQIEIQGLLRQRIADAKAQAAGQLTPGGLAQLAVQHTLYGSAAFSRMDPATRKEVINFESQKGLSPADGFSAQVEMKGLMAAAASAGRREGNITILQNSMAGAGQQVLETLGGVSRGNLTPLNAMIRTGKTLFSDPGEKAYAGAVQTFINEYGRVIGGGNAQVTDSARHEAMALLSTADGPDAVRAAIRQLAEKETKIVADAGDTALEILAAKPIKGKGNGGHYNAILRIQDAAGVPLLGALDPTMASESGAGAPAAPAAPATPAMKSTSKSGKPITSTDGGKTWQYD